MILGIGIDLVEIVRIDQSLQRFGDSFIQRIFLPSEIEYCRKMKSPSRHFAARFAAKEAVSKAFGTGFGKKLGWKDIEVCRSAEGQPHLVFHGNGKKMAKERGVTQTHLSLTHHETTAAAFVILEGN